MKKLLLGVCSLAFVSCLSVGVALSAPVEVAEAEEPSIFTETKIQISNNTDKMLVVTGITDVSVVYEVGYKINGATYVAGEGETAETYKYYQGLTLGGVTKTASQFIDGAEGLLIWEVNYNPTVTYSVVPYAYVGTLQGDQLIAPENPVATLGNEKANFNVMSVKFVDEEGEEIETVSVNYGATVGEITAPEKDGYTFKGWYVDGVEYNFETKVTSDMEITAVYTAPANYTVRVMAAQYAKEDISGGYRILGAKTYVDKTSEYASVFGLDENGQAKAMVDSTVDLTSAIAALKGAKLNATDSNVSGIVAEDGSLELTVYLDFDEEVLGFKLSDVTLGVWQLETLTFTLKYFDGVCGMAIESPLTGGWGKQVEIKFSELVVNDYATIKLNYYELDPTNPKAYIYDGEGTEGAENSITAKTMVNSYGKYAIDLVALATADTISGVKIKIGKSNTASWSCFITGIEKKAYLKENVTYSVANGNIMDIATPIGGVELSTATQTFGDYGRMEALYYNYSGADVTGDHQIGIIFNLNVKVSDYERITIVYWCLNNHNTTDGYTGNGNNTNFWLNGVAYPDDYAGSRGGGVQTVDLIQLAKDKNKSTISTFELQINAKNPTPSGTLYIAYIEFVLA